MRIYSIAMFLFWSLQGFSQTDKSELIGEWKKYLDDKTSFELLKLNPDGTGLKCFGQTFNNKDTLFLNHVTALLITKWKIEKKKLIIESKNTVSFRINTEYKFNLLPDGKMELMGEHLIFYLYPSILNRNEFKRSVTYQKADKILNDYGVITTTCITKERNLFSLTPIDSTIQTAEYKGFQDLIPYIVACGYGYTYVQNYFDPSYYLNVPISLKKWSFGFGDKSFYISFDSEQGDISETSIVVYYDFDNKMKNYFFSQVEKGREKKEIVKQNNIDIYKTINWQGKYSGQVFLKNSIAIAYYTRDVLIQDKLQKCITSFRYK